jgi:hypothetical protein
MSRFPTDRDTDMVRERQERAMTEQPKTTDASKAVKAFMWTMTPFAFLAVYLGFVGGPIAFIVIAAIGVAIALGVAAITAILTS